MMQTAVVIIGLVYTLAGAAHAPVPDAERAFQEFVRLHGRLYRDEAETRARFHAFTESLAVAARKNQDPNELAEFGINKFSDYTTEEFLGNFTRTISHDEMNSFKLDAMNFKNGRPLIIEPKISFESQLSAFDWRDYHVVTKVKDQGNCPAAHAFALAGALEAQYVLKHNKTLTDFSAQELISCTEFPGCSFTTLDPLLRLVFQTGIETEKDYPYEGKIEECKADAGKVIATLDGIINFYVGPEEILVQLLEFGPVILALDGTALKDYKGGILTNCPSEGLPNMMMLLVGFGVENNVPFWIVKTSYGADFGEKGYVRIKRGVNACGINLFKPLHIVPTLDLNKRP